MPEPNGSSDMDGRASKVLDVVVVGAGFAGLYALHRLRGAGFTTRVLEAADGVGGTWYWNAYPGARCDVESLDYSYSFSPELDQEWVWSERYGTQPEILRYLNHVADRFELRRDIQFGTRVEAATYDEAAARWTVVTDAGERFDSRFVVFATGSLSAPLHPPFDGVDDFAGDWFMTQMWPHEGVELAGKRVALVGTGSSAIQVLPEIVGDAAHVTVFQRTPNFSVPGKNRALSAEEVAERKATYPEYREQAKWTPAGMLVAVNMRKSREMTAAERIEELERRWDTGGAVQFTACFRDLMFSTESNEFVQEFIRSKIRATVTDPGVAELLCPTDHPFATKRPCVDHGYYDAFNRPNVTLVDIRSNPIDRITPAGVRLTDGAEHAVDLIVYAIGYDALSGALERIDIRGRDGRRLTDAWASGPRTLLGLGVAGFPNLFTVTGPGSPSVLVMMVAAIEQHVDWITDCLEHMRADGLDEIEVEEAAQDEWMGQVAALANASLYPRARSYYMGANVPGKPLGFTIYIGGLHTYRQACDDVAAAGYRGFRFRPAQG